MSINKEKDIYLKEGKLDLSILDEGKIENFVTKEDQEDQEEHSTILEDLESMDLTDVDISATLQEMAMMFEEDKEFDKKD